MVVDPGSASTPDEPVRLTILSPEGALVAELVVGPRISVSRVKRQLAGIEGTAAGNQVLLLNGQQLEDGCQPLCSAGAAGTATFVLAKRAPLLSGQLTVSDLERLLDDEAALQDAIDAYRDNLQYSVAEARTIADAVASALAPGTEALAAEMAAEVAAAPDIADNLLGVRRVLRQRFGRAVRAALESVREAVAEVSRQRHPEQLREEARNRIISESTHDDGEVVAAAAPRASKDAPGQPLGAASAERAPDGISSSEFLEDAKDAPGQSPGTSSAGRPRGLSSLELLEAAKVAAGQGVDVGALREGLRDTPEKVPDPEVEALRKRPSRGAAPELALLLERRFKACEDAANR